MYYKGSRVDVGPQGSIAVTSICEVGPADNETGQANSFLVKVPRAPPLAVPSRPPAAPTHPPAPPPACAPPPARRALLTSHGVQTSHAEQRTYFLVAADAAQRAEWVDSIAREVYACQELDPVPAPTRTQPEVIRAI